MNLERSINVQARLENGRMKLNRTHYSKRPLIYLPVGRTLGGIDELVSQAFRNGFDVAESRLTCTSSEEIDGLVNTTQRGNINGLSPHNTSRTNTGGIFPRSTGFIKETSICKYRHILTMKSIETTEFPHTSQTQQRQ